MPRLFRKGVPLQIRVYDNEGVTPDRFTIVYISPGQWQHYAQMGIQPRGPFGTLNYDVSRWPIDESKPDGTKNGAPPRLGHRHAWLGKRIAFNALPDECKDRVLQDYREIWNRKG